MRRNQLLGLLAVLAVATVVIYSLTARRPAHISSLVSGDFSFGVFSSSVNDLDQLYDAPHRNREANPPRLRFGDPVNVPGLDGFSYDDPVGSFHTAEGDEVFLVPVRDEGALEDAFESEREQITIRLLSPPASNYLALSQSPLSVRRGARNDLVLKASQYPLALAGHPKNGRELRLMLTYLFLRESPRKPSGVPVMVREAGRIPGPVADRIAAECDGVMLGFRMPENGVAPVRVDGEIDLKPDGMVARSAHLAAQLGLTNVAASFPFNTVLLLGGVLDGAGWKEAGLPLPVGDAALAFGVVDYRTHARRYTLLIAARPASPERLQELRERGYRALVGGDELAFKSVRDEGTEVRTRELEKAPPWLEGLLRSSAKVPFPVFVSTATERGIWYCAIGSQAEGTVRRALDCLRDKPELGLQRSGPVGAHREFLGGPHVALALVTPEGLKALEYRMPLFEIASLGQPPAITCVVDVDDKAKLDIRIAR